MPHQLRQPRAALLRAFDLDGIPVPGFEMKVLHPGLAGIAVPGFADQLTVEPEMKRIGAGESDLVVASIGNCQLPVQRTEKSSVISAPAPLRQLKSIAGIGAGNHRFSLQCLFP